MSNELGSDLSAWEAKDKVLVHQVGDIVPAGSHELEPWLRQRRKLLRDQACGAFGSKLHIRVPYICHLFFSHSGRWTIAINIPVGMLKIQKWLIRSELPRTKHPCEADTSVRLSPQSLRVCAHAQRTSPFRPPAQS